MLNAQLSGKLAKPRGKRARQRSRVGGRRKKARTLDPEQVMSRGLNDIAELVEKKRFVEPSGPRPAVRLPVSKIRSRLILSPGVGGGQPEVRKKMQPKGRTVMNPPQSFGLDRASLGEGSNTSRLILIRRGRIEANGQTQAEPRVGRMAGDFGRQERFEPVLGELELEVKKIKRTAQAGHVGPIEMDASPFDPAGFECAGGAELDGRIEKIHGLRGRLKDALPVELLYHNLRQVKPDTDRTGHGESPIRGYSQASASPGARKVGGPFSQDMDLSNP